MGLILENKEAESALNLLAKRNNPIGFQQRNYWNSYLFRTNDGCEGVKCWICNQVVADDTINGFERLMIMLERHAKNHLIEYNLLTLI